MGSVRERKGRFTALYRVPAVRRASAGHHRTRNARRAPPPAGAGRAPSASSGAAAPGLAARRFAGDLLVAGGLLAGEDDPDVPEAHEQVRVSVARAILAVIA